ncbi:MAG: hypothetical protein ACLPHP_07195 [Candidatus Sulfotelmatobacter sp.]
MMELFDAGKNLVRVEQTRLRHQLIEGDRQERIAQHKRDVAERRALLAATPGAAQPLNLFADGDSWFDYPLPLEGRNDVIRSIGTHGKPQPLILNLAHYGDEARDLLGVKRRQRIIDNLSDEENGRFDAILFSGGGNDTVGNQFCLWIQDYVSGMKPSEGINAQRLAAVLGVVRSAYEDLIVIRDRILPECPILVHAYDFAIPTDKGICGKLIGPWLKPSLVYRGWTDMEAGTLVVKEFLLQFRNTLTQIAAAHKNVVYVETQGTLAPDEWENELHPTPPGFDKIAGKFLAALRAIFPGRI